MTESTPTGRRMIGGRMVDVPLTHARPAEPLTPAAELAHTVLYDALAGDSTRIPPALEVLCHGAMGDLMDHPRVRQHITGDSQYAAVDWAGLSAELDQVRMAGSEMTSGGGDALLRIACSLAGYGEVNLQAAIGRLDKGNRRVVLLAMFSATGLAGEVWPE